MWLYWVRRLRREPGYVLGLGVGLLLAYLVVAPVVIVATGGFRVQPGHEVKTGAAVGDWTLYYVERLVRSRVAGLMFWRPLANTLTLLLGVTCLALTLGGAVGWVLAHKDVAWRGFLEKALVVPYMMPSWTYAVVWLWIFRNRRVAGAPGLLETLGWEPPDWMAYGAVPLILTLGVHYAPFAMLLVRDALRRFDWTLDEAAAVAGAKGWRRTGKIVAPLLLPALGSAALLIMARAVGSFGAPYLLGVPVGFEVLSVSLYRQARLGEFGVMALLALVAIALGASLVAGEARVTGGPRRFAVVSSGSGVDRRELGRLRGLAGAVAWVVFVVVVPIPLGLLLASTMMRIPGVLTLANITWDFWLGTRTGYVGQQQGLLLSEALWRALWNSVWISGLAAALGGAIGFVAAYVTWKLWPGVLSHVIRQIALFPMLVPGIALGAAYLWWFGVPRGPVPSLYGTNALLVVALCVANLPFCFRAAVAAVMQLGGQLEEAAQVCGARWWHRFGRVTGPMCRDAIAGGCLLAFVSGLRELSLVVMLATPGTEVLTTLAIRLSDYGYVQLRDGVVLITVVVALASSWLVRRTGGRGERWVVTG